MQQPEIFDLPQTSKQAPALPVKSDASFFSPLADRKGLAPRCARCGNEAEGGVFIEMDSGYPIGQVTGTVEFICACAGIRIYSISVDNVEQWQLFRQVQPGVFRVRKRPEAERIAEIKEQNAGR